MSDQLTAQEQKIYDQIVQERGIGQYNKHVALSGKQVPEDWDDDLFISETMYDDVYLKLVQQEYRGKEYTFEDCLKECLKTLHWRREELDRERLFQVIDQRTHQNALMVVELAEGAIRKYLERSPNKRLIGV